ncbi:MAG: 50S ribosomal protein L29 [Candidatus Saccharibacteria bacterium]
MKAKELHNKSQKELQKDLADLRETYAKTLIDMRTKEVKNVKTLHGIKKNIARVLTVLKEQELQGDKK